MIHSLVLTFSPKTKEDFEIFDSILKQFKYKRNLIIEPIDSNIKLFIFTDKKFIQFKIYDLAEYLSLNEITNRDYNYFSSKFNKSINHFGLSLNQLNTTRLDYKLDLQITADEMQEYLYVFSKLRKRYYSLKKKVYWNKDKSKIETVYYKGSKFNINIYDKQAQLLKKGIHDSIYNNILRIEVQVKSRELNNYSKSCGISKDLINFWHTSVRDYFFNYLLIDKLLYSGDYYNLKNVKKQINNVKLSTQQRIIKFCKQIAKEDITDAINSLSRETAQKYIKELTDRNVNPITIKNFNSLMGIKTILKEKEVMYKI